MLFVKRVRFRFDRGRLSDAPDGPEMHHGH